MSSPVPTGRFRADIQALRAAAVLLVVVFHLWPGRLPGGYVGVDAFFVISGFLITGHLVREADASGRIDLGQFWARRARRLLPAAYLVLAVSALAVWLWFPVMSWHQNFREIIGSTLYVQNWVLASDSVDYLAAENTPSVAQHYWTLSVEEQFYLVWPLLVVLGLTIATRTGWTRRRTIAAVLALTTFASFVFSWWITTANPPAAYFVTPARAWQFGAGALLALAIGNGERGPRPTPRAAALLSWAGFLALAWCGLRYDADLPFPGTAALVPVAATVVVIWAGTPAGRLSPTPLMNLTPVRFLGDHSYAMYLWHWPPIVILPVVLGHELGLLPRVAIFFGTIVAAWLTKRFVEDPVRFTSRFGLRKPAVTALATAVGALALTGGALQGRQVALTAEAEAVRVAESLAADAPACFGAASMDPREPCTNPDLDGMLVPSPEAVGQDIAEYQGCWQSGVHQEELNEDCSFGDPDLPHVILVGDSHARAMLPAFVRMAENGLIHLDAQLRGSCAWTRDPIDHPDALRVSSCQVWKDNLQDWLLARASTTDLIVTTGYARFISGSTQEKVASMVSSWRPLVEAGVRIAAIGDNPWHRDSPVECLARLDRVEPNSCAISRDEAFSDVDPFLAAGGRLRQTYAIDLSNFYCTPSVCPAVIGGVNVYRDRTHVSVTYAQTLSPFIYRELNERGLVESPAGQ